MAKDHFEIYSCGLFYMSVCTNIEDREEILRRANHVPIEAGAESIWDFSKDKTFRQGKPNPCPCEDGKGMHYLLDC